MIIYRLLKRAKRFKIRQILLVGIILVLLSLGFNWLIPKDQKGDLMEEFPIITKFLPILRKIRKISDIVYLPYFFERSELPVYEIIIDPDDLGEMQAALPEFYSEDFFTDANKVWKKAKLKDEGVEYEIEVRYRGCRAVHWNAPKKSIKIKLNNPRSIQAGGGKDFAGASSLSFIIPNDRFFIVEDFNNYRASKLDLMPPESHFGILKINGKSQGLYFIVEAWSEEFLAKAEVADESNFFDVDEVSVWLGRKDDIYDNLFCWSKYTKDSFHEYDDYSAIDLFIKTIRGASDQWLEEHFFDLVDEDSFYNWRVHALLMNSYHGNLHMYHNQDDGKFYFIPWDVGLRGNIPKRVDTISNPLVKRILSVPGFMHERNKRLYNYVSDESNLEDDIAYYDDTYQNIKTALYRDRLKIYSNLWADARIKEYREVIIKNYKKIRQAFEKARVIIQVEVNSVQEGASNNTLAKLEIMVDNFTDVEFRGLELPWLEKKQIFKPKLYKDVNNNGFYDSQDKLIARAVLEADDLVFDDLGEILMTQRDMGLTRDTGGVTDFIQTKYTYFLVANIDDEEIDWDKIDFKMVNYFTRKKLEDKDLSIHLVDGQAFKYFERINMGIGEFLTENPIFAESKGGLLLRTGVYNINEDIIIPKGLFLKIKEGTELRIKENISFISYSPVEILGTKSRPVLITSQDKSKPWGVFAVQSASGRSLVQYAKFENGGETYINGTYYSGMLAVHYSDVDVSNCIFKNANGDDGLNIKKAQVEITNNYFYKNNYDALDLDWTSGRVAGNYFLDNSNDSIDLDGVLDLELENNYVNKSGDKCLSIGEKSQNVIIFNNLFKGCMMGIAVKGDSDVKIINDTVIDNEVGVAVYQKKPVFGGASPVVYNSIIRDNNQSITLDDESSIKVSNSFVEGGWPGDNNLESPPDYNDNYLSGLGGGEVDIINEMFDKEYKEINLGIISPVFKKIPF